MNIVAVVNQKGGVAKTTTTANLGACLAAKGYRTLLIDLDPQANLTLGLRREWDDLPYGLQDVLLDWWSRPLSGVVRQIAGLPLYLAPGHLELARTEAILLRKGGSAYGLRRALTALDIQNKYDWVLIDCPPSLGMLTQNGIVASSYLVIPTEPKMYAFAGMDTLNKMVAELAKEYQFEVDVLGVLLTMYEKRTRLHKTIEAVIRERFGAKVFDTVIYRNVRLSESEIEGKPIIQFDKSASGAINYEAVAEEVLARAGSVKAAIAV
jgi:chromosome partitioning protein